MARRRHTLSVVRVFASIIAALASCVVLAGTAPAGATDLQEVGSFGASGIVPAPRNPFRPSRIAVDERTHDVYVIDEGNAAVDRFHADGTFVSQLDPSPSPSGRFTFPPSPDDSDITVDNTAGPGAGNVYLTDEYYPNNAYAFDAHGSFLWEKRPTDPLPTGNWDPCGVAVDPSGLVHISDWYHSSLLAFDAGGLLQGTLDLPFPSYSSVTTCHTAYDDSGDLYYAGWEQGLGLHRPGGPFTTLPLPSTQTRVYALAVRNGGLLADVGNELLAYDSSGQPFADSPLLAGEIGNSLGIAVDHSNGRVYVSDTAGRIRVFSASASSPPPPVPPAIAPPTIGEWVGPVPPFDVPGEQTVRASIDSHGSLLSDCHVEWGSAGASVWSHMPCSPQPGAGVGPANVSAVLSGPYTGVYHFQFIATNGGGTTLGPIHTFVLSGLGDTVTVAPPTGTLAVSSIRTVGRAHVRVAVTCKGAAGASCRGMLKVRVTIQQRHSRHPVEIGRARYDVHVGRTAIRVALSLRGRRLIGQHRRLHISALV